MIEKYTGFRRPKNLIQADLSKIACIHYELNTPWKASCGLSLVQELDTVSRTSLCSFGMMNILSMSLHSFGFMNQHT